MHSWLYPVFLQEVNKSKERKRVCQLLGLELTLMLNIPQLVEFQLDMYIYFVISSSEIQGSCTANRNVFGLLKVRNQVTSFLSVTCVLTFKRKWLCFF